MDLDDLQKKVDDALANSTCHEDSVPILEGMGFSARESMAIAAAHHGEEHRGVREVEEGDRYVPPDERWPEAHAEVYAQARTEDEAADIFRRHGLGDLDAEQLARLIFAYGQEELRALSGGYKRAGENQKQGQDQTDRHAPDE